MSDLFAGSLIALALLFQMNLLFESISLSKKSQLTAFYLFMCAIPLYFFLGGVHSFIILYFNESQWLFLFITLTISFALCFVANFFTFFIFKYIEANQFQLSAIYLSAFQDIKKNKKNLFYKTFLILIFSFIPYLNSDWKIIFALTATQFVYHRPKLKQAFGF
jgi:hypothetical protein